MPRYSRRTFAHTAYLAVDEFSLDRGALDPNASLNRLRYGSFSYSEFTSRVLKRPRLTSQSKLHRINWLDIEHYAEASLQADLHPVTADAEKRAAHRITGVNIVSPLNASLANLRVTLTGGCSNIRWHPGSIASNSGAQAARR